ncbi:MAG: hypothetical protein ACREIJ_08690 [Nitrospiraceae bacterium]
MKAQVNGITIAYSDQGTGLPIVFLHAFPLNRTMWATQENPPSGVSARPTHREFLVHSER